MKSVAVVFLTVKITFYRVLFLFSHALFFCTQFLAVIHTVYHDDIAMLCDVEAISTVILVSAMIIHHVLNLFLF